MFSIIFPGQGSQIVGMGSEFYKNFKKENNFESALKRLEEISDLLENEDTPLEDSIKLFEEGIELKEFCEDKLKSAKLKIDKIVKRNKSLTSTEFKWLKILMSILSKINLPKELKKLSFNELQKLNDELRDYTIEIVSKT